MLKIKKKSHCPDRLCNVVRVLVTLIIFTLLSAFPVSASVTDGTRRYVLENGLTILLKEDHSSPVAAAQLWVRTGSANEEDEEAGITHQIEHMIFKGTPTRGPGEIARTIEAAGGHINAYTSYDRTVYFVEIDSRQIYTAIDVLLDAVQHSLFDPVELEREKEVVLEEYRRYLDIPERRLSRALMSLAYKEHSYRRPIIGYESTIRSFDRRMIMDYINKWYTPDNMVLVVVGDFDSDRALKTIQALVKNFPERKGDSPARKPEPEQTSLRKILLHHEVHQVYLDMSWHIPPLTHEDMPALDLLEIALAHGKSSRLYRHLKMEQNLVNEVNAGAYPLIDPGLFSVDATLAPENLERTLRVIAEEIQRLTRETVSDEEIERAKRIAEAQFVFSMEDMAGQARTLAFFQTMYGDMYEANRYRERLKKVTPGDIKEVADKYLRPNNLSVGLLVPQGVDIKLSHDKIHEFFLTNPGISSGMKKQEPQENPTMQVLPNGMRLIMLEDHRLPLVSIRGVFLGGVRLEREGEWGISKFVAKMLTKGTGDLDAVQIASLVESWAGRLSSFSGRNSFGISAKFLGKDLYPGLNLIADLVLNPAFPAAEIEKIRKDMLADIKAKKDHPQPQLFDLFYKTLYRSHPYGHPATGSTETISAMQREDLLKWYKDLAIPSNFVLAVAGDLDRERLLHYIKKRFSMFSPSARSIPSIPPEPPLESARVAGLQKAGAQTHLVIGYLGAGLKSRENESMELLQTALSGQGGRLFIQLRDRESLAYSVTAFRQPGLETGVFGVYIACDPKKLDHAKKALFAQLDQIRTDGLSPEELASAKKYLIGNLRIDLQTNGSRAMQMALDELYGLGYDHTPKFIDDIRKVTLVDIKKAAQKIITPGKYVLVTVGPNNSGE